MKTALLLVDIQNDYFPGGTMELFGSNRASANTRIVLNKFRADGCDVIHVQHISTRPNATFFLPNTFGAEIHGDVTPEEGEAIIIKHFPNSFRNTALHDLLVERKIERIVIAGMMTHMCIDTTVRAAFDFGYKCILLSDCCATRELKFQGITVSAEQVNASYLSAINGMFADVMTSNELIAIHM